MLRYRGESSVVAALVAVGVFAVSLIVASAPASAGPLCSTLSGLTPATFTSCVVMGGGNAGQDTFNNVQSALNGVLDPDIALIPGQSYYPGAPSPVKAGSEFGSNVAGLFNFTQIDGHTFQFNLLPPGTDFLTIKQANGFEIFNVIGLMTPILVTHQIAQPGFSHFSTFASDFVQVPEPASLALLVSALLSYGVLRRRKRA